jgi:WS/DGAT/MGAT family acyltransferase
MNPLDAVWLMMETEDAPMHVGVLAIFRKPRNAPTGYLQDLAARFRAHRKPQAPWSFQLSHGGGNPLAPHLSEVRDFDIDFHFRHASLPAPGGERELGMLISQLHSNALDRSRPLWEFHLVEGLERDRFAFYLKVHHAMVDNVNGIPMLVSTLSKSARRRNLPPIWAQPLSGQAGEKEGPAQRPDFLGGLNEVTGSLTAMGRAAGGFLLNALRRGEGGSFLLPLGTPRSILNRHITAQRRIATQQFRQQRIEAIAAATDSTVNEILTYLCGSSLRRFFKEYNALPEESLVAAVPVSLQERSERLPGNAIAGLRVALGTHIGNPLARLEAVKASIHRVRKDRASLPAHAAAPYVMTRAIPVYASQAPLLGRFVPPLFNLAISNTPGPKKPVYFEGSRLESIYPLSPLLQFSALSIDCVSYAGTLNIGFTGARDTLPHLQRLAVYVGKALTDLEELVRQSQDAA